MTDHEKKLARERQQRKRAKKKEEMSSQKEKLLSVPDEKLTLQQAVNADDISGRTRNWLFIVYPESAPEDWRSILDSFHVPWIESPLHDADVNADATEKKAHWHIMLLFDSVKSYQQILPFSRAVNGSFPIKCRSLRGSVRYFYHADNPEKAQYSKTDIKAHCGAELEKSWNCLLLKSRLFSIRFLILLLKITSWNMLIYSTIPVCGGLIGMI